MPGNPATQGLTASAAKDALRTDSFGAQLGREYYTLANFRADNDWVDADDFARKSLADSKGEVVPAEDNRK